MEVPAHGPMGTWAHGLRPIGNIASEASPPARYPHIRHAIDPHIRHAIDLNIRHAIDPLRRHATDPTYNDFNNYW